MTGTITGTHPVQAALLYSFEHARQDLRRWTAELSDEQLWMPMGEVAPVGFHIRHIAGSVDRLITYAKGESLSEAQMGELQAEQRGKPMPYGELIAFLEQKLSSAEAVVRSLNSAEFQNMREIGRKRIPVPLGVLLVHIAEHTQRHVGAAIVTAKLVRQTAKQ